MEIARTVPAPSESSLLDLDQSAIPGLLQVFRSRLIPQRPLVPTRRVESVNHDVLAAPAGGALLTVGQVELLEQVASGRPLRAVYAARAISSETLHRELTSIYGVLGATAPHVGVGRTAAQHASRALEVLAALQEAGQARGDLLSVETKRGELRSPEHLERLREVEARLTWAHKRLDSARSAFQTLTPDAADLDCRRHRGRRAPPRSEVMASARKPSVGSASLDR